MVSKKVDFCDCHGVMDLYIPESIYAFGKIAACVREGLSFHKVQRLCYMFDWVLNALLPLLNTFLKQKRN